jgi:hypothetical protein
MWFVLLALVAESAAQGQSGTPLLGVYARVKDLGAAVYPDSSFVTEPLLRPVVGSAFVLLGRVGNWCAVLLPDGSKGWILVSFIETTSHPEQRSEDRSTSAFAVRGAEFGGALAGTLAANTVGALMFTVSISWALDDLFSGFSHSGGSGIPEETQALVCVGGLGALVAAPPLAAYGAHLSRSRSEPAGQFWPACAGGLIGGIAGGASGYALGALMSGSGGGAMGLLMFGGMTLGTAFGAASGYNLSRPREMAARIPARLELPELGMRTTETGVGRATPELNLRLLGYRF